MNEPHLSLERVRSILQRATALEAEIGSTISVTELRRIGEECGIQGEALDRAIDEELLHATAPAARALDRPWVRYGIAAGVALGATTMVLFSGGLLALGVITGVGGVLMTSGAMAGLIRNRKPVLEYYVANLSLWAGYTCSAVVAYGGGLGFTSDLVLLALAGLGTSSLVGGVIIRKRLAQADSTDSAGTVSTRGSGGGGHALLRMRQKVQRLWRYLNQPVARSAMEAASAGGEYVLR